LILILKRQFRFFKIQINVNINKALRAKRAGLSKPNVSEKLKNVKSEAKVRQK